MAEGVCGEPGEVHVPLGITTRIEDTHVLAELTVYLTTELTASADNGHQAGWHAMRALQSTGVL